MRRVIAALCFVLAAETALAGNGSITNPSWTSEKQGNYALTTYRTVTTSSVCVIGQTGDTCTGGTVIAFPMARSFMVQNISTSTDAVTCVMASGSVPTAVAAQGHTLAPGQAVVFDKGLVGARVACIAASGTQTIAYTIEGNTNDLP